MYKMEMYRQVCCAWGYHVTHTSAMVTSIWADFRMFLWAVISWSPHCCSHIT